MSAKDRDRLDRLPEPPLEGLYQPRVPSTSPNFAAGGDRQRTLCAIYHRQRRADFMQSHTSCSLESPIWFGCARPAWAGSNAKSKEEGSHGWLFLGSRVSGPRTDSSMIGI